MNIPVFIHRARLWITEAFNYFKTEGATIESLCNYPAMDWIDDASLAVTTPRGYQANILYANKPLNTDGQLTVTRATPAWRVNQFGLLEEVAANVPRVDYLRDKCGEWLLEPQRTNLLTYSEQFDNAAWVKTLGGTGVQPSVTPNIQLAPDGTLTADQVVFNTGSGTTASDRSEMYQAVATTSGINYNGSFWIKGSVGGEKLVFRHAGNVTYTEIDLTTEWQRINVTELANTTVCSYTIGIRQGLSGIGSINSSATVYIWGAQFEAGAYATSPIPTTTTTATRNADDFLLLDLASRSHINSTSGWFYLDIELEQLVRDSSLLVAAIGALNGRVYVYNSTTSSELGRVFVQRTDGTTFSYVLTQERNKILFDIQATEVNIYVNGSPVLTAPGPFSLTNTDLNFTGKNRTARVREFGTSPTRLTQARYTEITTL